MGLQESALVETQIDAGSADRVPVVRNQLQNATTNGQLQARCITLLKKPLVLPNIF